MEQEPEDGAIYEQVLNGILEKLQNNEFKHQADYQKQLEALANLYVKGYELDWKLLHQGEAHQKISLPTYPFLKKRYWINPASKTNISFSSGKSSRSPSLHPLIDSNESTLATQCYQTLLQPNTSIFKIMWLLGNGCCQGCVILKWLVQQDFWPKAGSL